MNSKLAPYIEQIPVRGLIHVGINDGEEVPAYEALGIDKLLCFEPLLPAWQRFIQDYPNVPCYPYALGKSNAVVPLNVSAGNGKGSSLLLPIKDHPEVVEKWLDGQADIVDVQEVQMYRLDDFFNRMNSVYKAEDYNYLVLDTQGTELDVLKGCGEYLKGFDVLSVELSKTPVYEGEPTADAVIQWLGGQGFYRVSPVFAHDDVFFIRKELQWRV